MGLFGLGKKKKQEAKPGDRSSIATSAATMVMKPAPGSLTKPPEGTKEMFDAVYNLFDIRDTDRVGMRTGSVILSHSPATEYEIEIKEGEVVEILEQKKNFPWILIRNPAEDPYGENFQGLVPSVCVLEIPFVPRTEIIKTATHRIGSIRSPTRDRMGTLMKLNEAENNFRQNSFSSPSSPFTPTPETEAVPVDISQHVTELRSQMRGEPSPKPTPMPVQPVGAPLASQPVVQQTAPQPVSQSASPQHTTTPRRESFSMSPEVFERMLAPHLTKLEQARLESLQQQRGLEAKVYSLEKTVATHEEAIKSLMQILEQSAITVNNVTSENETLKKEISTLRETVLALEKKSAAPPAVSIQAASTSAPAPSTESIVQIVKQELAKVDSTEKLGQIDGKLGTVSTDIQSLKQSVQELSAQQKTQKATLDSQATTLKQQSDTVQNLSKSQQSLQKQVESLSSSAPARPPLPSVSAKPALAPTPAVTQPEPAEPSPASSSIQEQTPVETATSVDASPAPEPSPVPESNIVENIQRKAPVLEVAKRAKQKKSAPSKKTTSASVLLKNVEEASSNSSLTNVTHESVQTKVAEEAKHEKEKEKKQAETKKQEAAPEETPAVPKKPAFGRGAPMPGFGRGAAPAGGFGAPGGGMSAELMAKLKKQQQ